MGFCAIMQEVDFLQESIQNQTVWWTIQLEEAKQSVNEYIASMQENASGELAESICTYLTEVHLYLIDQLCMAQTELQKRMLQYGERLFEIEENVNGYISEQTLEDEANHLVQERSKFSNVADAAERSMQTVSDLISGMPTSVGVEQGIQEQVRLRMSLIDSIMNCETAYKDSTDVLGEMQECIRALLERYNTLCMVNPWKYESSPLIESEEGSKLSELEKAHNAYLWNQSGSFQKCEGARRARLLAKARVEAGKQQIKNGLLLTGIGVITVASFAVAGPPGAAATISIWAEFGVASGASIFFCRGTSEMVEGIGSVELGKRGDIWTRAYNPMRDELCGGSQEIYDLIGNIGIVSYSLGTDVLCFAGMTSSLGVKGLLKAGGMEATQQVAQTATTSYMVEELGMDPVDATVLNMFLGNAVFLGGSAICGKISGSSSVAKWDWDAFESGSGNKIKPSNSYNVDAKPSGTITKITDKMDDATKRSLARENEAAETIAKNGYDIEQNPIVEGTTRNPDYIIEGEIFDCYSPAENTKIRNVASTIEEKVIEKGQAERVVLNLDDWKGDVDALVKQLNDYPIEGLKEVIVVYDGNVQSIYP